MDKFLIFIDAADDAAMYPLSQLLGMTVAADATLLIKFGSSIQSGGTDGSSADIVTVTTTADKELVVFKALAKAITDIGAFNGEKFLVVCDDVNSVFAHPDILSCTIAIDS